mmetsp:Transcript_6022/g.23401  ORF Transcript_6022/g.23401 Transcript_6022/m.23401 type:complete len:347 (-) Transcript_6022:73-1113(-)
MLPFERPDRILQGEQGSLDAAKLLLLLLVLLHLGLQASHILLRLPQRLLHSSVLGLDLVQLLLLLLLRLLHLRHLLLEALDEVEVIVRDVVVVVLDLAERSLVGLHEALDVRILLVLDALKIRLALAFQVLAERLHPLLVDVVHLRRSALKVFAQHRALPVLVLAHALDIVVEGRIDAHELHAESAAIGLELQLGGAVLILRQLDSPLPVRFLQSDLILELVQQVLDPLLVDLDFHRLALLQILHFAILVAQFGLLVLQLLLLDDPEVVDLLALLLKIIEKPIFSEAVIAQLGDLLPQIVDFYLFWRLLDLCCLLFPFLFPAFSAFLFGTHCAWIRRSTDARVSGV